MKKYIISAILLLAIAGSATCQDLLIRHDMVNKKIEYFKVRKYKDGTQKITPVTRPRIRPNKSVKVEHVNINPFVYEQPRMNIVTTPQDSVASFNPFAMLMPTNITDKMGFLNLASTRDASTADPQQQMCAAALSSLYDAYDEVDALKYSYKLTKEQILEQSRMKIKSVLKTSYAYTHVDTSLRDYKKNDFQAMKNYFKDICQVNMPVASRSGNDSKLDSFLGNSDAGSKDFIMPQDALNQIEKDYLSVEEADFSFENSFIVSDKDVVLNMGYSLTDEYKKKASKDSIAGGKSKKQTNEVKDESVFIPVSGGVRISNSAGIGFTYLGTYRKTYYLENDSVLASSPDNRIVPVIGTFLNAYSRGLGVINIGGSFGIGVAIEETLSINYMFGITTVIGRKERLLFSAGLVLGPVSEPTKGYYVGKQTTNADFPTKLSYKPGIFFCVHYNIGKF